LSEQDNAELRRKELSMSSMSIALQQRFQSMQMQVDGLSATIRTQLLDPISEEEYHRLEELPPTERDLIDTIKLGVYQQLGLLRAARDTAVRRSSDLSVAVESLTAKCRHLEQDVADLKALHDSDMASTKRHTVALELKNAEVMEVSGKLADAERKLRSAYVEQEQLLSSKLTAASKSNELQRTQLLLKEAQSEVEFHKTEAQCSEQKLDILKSEYYELKLQHSQRVMELEAALRLAEEKLKVLGDMEMEAEAFLTNIATAVDVDQAGATSSGATLAEACGRMLCVPTSRNVHHAVTVTKKCLSLENQLVVSQSEVRQLQLRIKKLESSLEMCRAALNNTNAPFALAERSVEMLSEENEQFRQQLKALRGENSQLLHKVDQLTADVSLLSRHRSELLRIQRVLATHGVHAEAASGTAGLLQQPQAAAFPAASAAPQRRASPVKQGPPQMMRREWADPGIALAAPITVSAAQSLRYAMPYGARDNSGAVLNVPEMIEIS
jgi:chromosome segregation ATPase